MGFYSGICRIENMALESENKMKEKTNPKKYFSEHKRLRIPINPKYLFSPKH